MFRRFTSLIHSYQVSEHVNDRLTLLPTEVLRRRLLFTSRHRGILENDLLLSTFAAQHLSKMTEHQVHEYARLLDTEQEWDLFYWMTGEREVPERWQNSQLMKMLQEHTSNQGKVVRLMPSLESS